MNNIQDKREFPRYYINKSFDIQVKIFTPNPSCMSLFDVSLNGISILMEKKEKIQFGGGTVIDF